MRLRQAFAVVVVLVAIVLGAAVISGFQLYEGAVTEREQQSLQTTADATATQFDGLLAERVRTIELFAANSHMMNASEHRRTILQRLIRETPYQGVSVIRADGIMHAIESEGLSEANRTALLGQDFSNRTYFQRAMTGKTYVSEPVQAETDNHIITVSTPIRVGGEVVGTLNGALHLSDGSFFEALPVVEDADHEVRISAGNQRLYASGPVDRRDLATATATINSTGWTVTAVRPDASSGQTELATGLQVGAVLLVLGSLIGFGVWFKRSNLDQIEELLDGFDQLAERSFGTEIAVGGAQEWDTIGTRFNEVSRELARHERELKRYREIVERVTDPIAIQDSDGNYRLVNRALADISGYPSEELLGADESLYLDDHAADQIERKRREVLETNRPVEYEQRVEFDQTNIEATYSIQQYPYYDEEGTLAGTLSVYRDVTDLKARETELQQYKRAVDGATDLICALDQDMTYLFANPQYCAYHDIDQETVPGTEITGVFGEDPPEKLTANARRALDGETVKYTMTRTHPVHGQRILDVRYYPLGEGKEVTGFVAVLRDVTEREERSRQLRVVDRVLRHNLRNDLTVISLEAERITDGASGEVAAAAETIQNHAEELLTTSNKSRKITEVLSGTPDHRTVEVREMLETMKRDVDSENAEITLDCPGEVQVSAADSLHSGINELVTNAIVHSDQTTPSIEIIVEQTADHVCISVADDGPGISKMDQDVLESGRAIEDLYHGSGLGLWLVHWIVHRSGGSIAVRDRTPRGTAVEVELPRAPE
jgi:PAS domain S-box-containing protein